MNFFFSQINPSKEKWTLIVRVIRSWHGPLADKSGLPLSYNMLLIDGKVENLSNI